VIPHEPVHCPVAEACGGCAFIGGDYAEQLGRKRDRVREAVTAERLDASYVEPCTAAPRVAAYRNRAKLAVATRQGEVHVGLHRRGTEDVVDLAECRVQSESTASALPAIRDWLAEHRLASPEGPVRHVDVREADDGRHHVTVIVRREPDDAPELAVASLVARLPTVVGVSVNFNPARSSYVFGEKTRTVHGERTFLTSVQGIPGPAFEVPAGGFFQVSTDLLGLSLARRVDANSVVGVEENPAAASCARRNAHRHGIDARYLTGRVERTLGDIDARGSNPVVLNPGRAGCRPAVIEWLRSIRASRIAYLSCNPESLARDLAALVEGPWTVERVVPFDLMPQTDHVETLALIAPASGGS
jgi:tRNA/tmRNA/rRNA uracil-C5-methylase (TrmA/RlmC/RlmD family)